MKITKKIGIAVLIVFGIGQFFRPEKNSGDVTLVESFEAETNVPENVKHILRATCYDCHSNNTNYYPWYNAITPVNFWLNSHIEEGKEHFNVSKWEGLAAGRKDHKLDELIEEVEEGEMPLSSYKILHGNARLSQEDITAIINWAKLARVKYGLASKPE